MISKSLLSFFNNEVAHRLGGGELTILDIGSGNRSLFEETPEIKAEITAIDINADLINQAPLSNIEYTQANVCDSSFFKEACFDLVFDSHCFNCLTKDNDRNQAYKNIFFSLKSGGIFASEMMVQPIDKKIFMPHKIVKTANEIEDELIRHQFKIKYFMISREFMFYDFNNNEEINCDMVRVIALK